MSRTSGPWELRARVGQSSPPAKGTAGRAAACQSVIVDLLLYTHPSFERHNTGPGHPERPARLGAAIGGVSGSTATVERRDAPVVHLDALHRIHSPEYVDLIRSFCEEGGGHLDPDTVAVETSWEAALRAAGAGLSAIEEMSATATAGAFLAVRPPGHHAETARAMGFCLFNNIAIAAAALVEEGEKVAIVDWDVHHGNGTQNSFYNDGRVLYASLHEFPAYPGSGWLDEVGSGRGEGLTINLPMPTGTGGDAYRPAMNDLIVPAIRSFGATWLLVSAGYDAHSADPLAGLRLSDGDYGVMASALRAAVPAKRTIYFLEGGYNLEALKNSVTATIDGGDSPLSPGRSPDSAWRIIDQVGESLEAHGLR